MKRVKYPLTPQAKEAAKALVEAWNNGTLEQRFSVAESQSAGRTGPTMFIGGVHEFAELKPPPLSVLLELSEYNLLCVQDKGFLLLQELRNAVENDFEVSDFFLTTSAVGTIVYGNLEVKEGAIFQSAAANEGDIIQNTGQLATKLEELLGSELGTNDDLRKAINALASVDEPSRLQKCGKVIQELGRCLGHTANTMTILSAINMVSQFLG